MSKGIFFLLIVVLIICPSIAATLSTIYSFNLVFPAFDSRAMDFWKNTDLVFQAIINVVKYDATTFMING